VNLSFVQSATFAGSQFPAGKLDHVFVSESGPTYATGPQNLGKRIVEFTLDANGNRLSGPTTLVEYTGSGQGTVVGLAAGPDGLYFTELYKDLNATTPIDSGARIFRVSYVNPVASDYDINGTVGASDYATWRTTFGSNLLLGADGNQNSVVDAADYVLWRKTTTSGAATAAEIANEAATAEVLEAVVDDRYFTRTTPAGARRSDRNSAVELRQSALGNNDDALVAWLASRSENGEQPSRSADVNNLGDEATEDDAVELVDQTFAELAAF
jgi:hypothetical protein